VGAWGTGSFENDDAVGWVAGLDAVTPEELMGILVRAADDPEYLEAGPARVAVAAGEVVAVLNGSGAESAPAAVVEWAGRHECTPELKAAAGRALERVRRNSEVKDLWMEADGLNEWIGAIKELQGRVEL
jgi:hypothetical protein